MKATSTHTAPLSKLDTDTLLEQLRVARGKRIDDDPFARRTWELRVVELQRELAIRNTRATAALGDTTSRIGERHTDLLEKFVDQYHEAYPDFCEAIEAALAALETQVAPTLPEDERTC